MDLIVAAVEKFAHDHTKAESGLYRRLRDETFETMEFEFVSGKGFG
jgi:hypothetical protein